MKQSLMFNITSSMFQVNWPPMTIQNLNMSDFQKIQRPAGYQIPGVVSGMVQAQTSNFSAQGFADSKLELAEDKAKSEAIERIVMMEWSRLNGFSDTSNGWACHPHLNTAIENALLELIERDVALRVWEEGPSYILIPSELWPLELKEWKERVGNSLEYSMLKATLCYSRNFGCVSVFLFNENGTCVVGHASKLQLAEALTSAFNECLRAAHSALRLEYFAEVMNLHDPSVKIVKCSPGAHSLAYAYKHTFPAEVQFMNCSVEQVQEKWRSHQQEISALDRSKFEIIAYKAMDRHVVRVRHPEFRQMYWGRVPNERLLKNKCPHNVG